MSGYPETPAGSERVTLWAGTEAERHGAQGETLMTRPLKSIAKIYSCKGTHFNINTAQKHRTVFQQRHLLHSMSMCSLSFSCMVLLLHQKIP